MTVAVNLTTVRAASAALEWIVTDFSTGPEKFLELNVMRSEPLAWGGIAVLETTVPVQPQETSTRPRTSVSEPGFDRVRLRCTTDPRGMEPRSKCIPSTMINFGCASEGEPAITTAAARRVMRRLPLIACVAMRALSRINRTADTSLWKTVKGIFRFPPGRYSPNISRSFAPRRSLNTP